MSVRTVEEVELEDLWGGILLYRSMMVTTGEIRPAAQVAAVKSDITRHGKLFVFQL